MIGTKARWVFVVAAVAVASPLAVGCKKDDSSSSKKGDDKKKSDDKKSGGDDKSDDSAAYAAGDVLSHVPKSCTMGRIYIDYAGLVASPAVKINAHKIDNKLAESVKGEDGEKAKHALKILEKAGIDPGKDIHEMAMCMQGKKDMTMVVGGDFAGKDVLGAIKKISEDDAPMKQKDADGVAYLKGKDKVVVAQLTPNVFAITENVDELADLAKTKDQSAKWDTGPGRLVVVKVTPKSDGVNDVSFEMTQKTGKIEAKLVVDVDEHTAQQFGKSPAQAESGIKQMLESVAKMMDKSPAASLADDLRDAKVKVDGNIITLTLKIPDADLAQTLQGVVDMNEADLEKLSSLR